MVVVVISLVAPWFYSKAISAKQEGYTNHDVNSFVEVLAS